MTSPDTGALPQSPLSVSVIIVSRGRAAALRRCLLGVAQLQYAPMEVVVVADPQGIAVAQDSAHAGALKVVPFDQPNISAARNLGITHAAGDIVAFLDDDAVPEPTWLHHLTAPAVQSDVAAMGGFVRGRNGISFQWQARGVDPRGETYALDVHPTQPTVLTPPAGHAVKTEGTNMAFRRDVLVALGGFDPAYAYFLDETDVNMRLARAGHKTAIVPLAEVHHGFAANAMRASNRAPRDLFDIGASWAVFQRKFVPNGQRAAQMTRLRHAERQRLLRHLITGTLEPRDIRRLMKRFDAGYAAGQDRALQTLAIASHPVAPFMRFPTRKRASVWIDSRRMRQKSGIEKAKIRANQGDIVTLLVLSWTTLYHQLNFSDHGVWMQRGGVFGKSNRSDRTFRMTTAARRSLRERKRVAAQRGLPK